MCYHGLMYLGGIHSTFHEVLLNIEVSEDATLRLVLFKDLNRLGLGIHCPHLGLIICVQVIFEAIPI